MFFKIIEQDFNFSNNRIISELLYCNKNIALYYNKEYISLLLHENIRIKDRTYI